MVSTQYAQRLSRAPLRSQRGFVLAMSLVFLLILTIIGISAMSTTSLQEKMANNVKDKSLSLQATDSALALLDAWLANDNITPPPIAGAPTSTSDGLHSYVDDINPPVWANNNFWSSSTDILTYPALPDGSPTSVVALPGVSNQPRYILEELPTINCASQDASASGAGEGGPPPKCRVFRYTVRAVGGTNAAVTISQNTHKKAAN